MCTRRVRRGISLTKFEIDDVIGCFSVKNVAKSGQLYILSLRFPLLEKFLWVTMIDYVGKVCVP